MCWTLVLAAENRAQNSTTFFGGADEEVIARLPSLAPPKTYADCVAYGVYDLLGCSAQDRANGAYHSAPLLLIPSRAQQCFHLFQHYFYIKLMPTSAWK